VDIVHNTNLFVSSFVQLLLVNIPHNR